MLTLYWYYIQLVSFIIFLLYNSPCTLSVDLDMVYDDKIILILFKHQVEQILIKSNHSIWPIPMFNVLGSNLWQWAKGIVQFYCYVVVHKLELP